MNMTDWILLYLLCSAGFSLSQIIALNGALRDGSCVAAWHAVGWIDQRAWSHRRKVVTTVLTTTAAVVVWPASVVVLLVWRPRCAPDTEGED